MNSRVTNLHGSVTARCGVCNRSSHMKKKDEELRMAVCNDCAEHLVTAEVVLYSHGLLYGDGSYEIQPFYRKNL